MKLDDIIQESKTLGFDRNGHLGYIIFESLPELSDDDRSELAYLLAPTFASNSQVSNFSKYKQHLETSFMRKIFGLTERNGTLLTITHPDRAEGCEKNTEMVREWENSFNFAKHLESSFLEHDRKFGLILLYEGLGHRYGDMDVVLGGDLSECKRYYNTSRDIATAIKCPKQMFVLYFWQGCYEFKLGMKENSISSMKMFHNGMHDLMDRARVFYGDKLKVSLDILRKSMDKKTFRQYCKQWCVKSKHNRMGKSFRGAL